MLLREKKYSNAKEVVERALASFSEETEFYFQRAEVYRQKLDYPSAINDISRVTILDPYSTRAFMTRGHLNKEFNQFQAAIADYGKVISLDSHNYAAYFYRGSCFQEISNKADAIADLSVITNAEKKLSSAEEIEILVKAKSRLFELKREKNPPSIALDVPKMENLSIKIPANKTTVLLDGIINDENDIAAATLNGVTLQLVNKRFLIEISIGDAKELLFDATDVYGNQSRTHIDIKRNEVDPPVIKLLSPFASENHEVYLESNAKSIYVEGIAQDENLITQISVNGINASYVPGDKNPKFSVTIPIDGVKQIDVEATDAFGNKAIYTYNINRDAAMMMQANPMGKTWVVFIENSNYETFASLEGPTKDIVLMKNAIANYQVNNLIHKKDLSKKQLERFFSIELRDLIRSNHVNSLVVWYAGHGKFINETGYWIPVDAKRDDEFTYFNINNLKAAMQSYSNEITHTLVITDACESGPTFYQAMRAMGGKRSCDDPQATRFRSSQVFSSAGYELAADNSQFTKAFAKALEVNESSCLSIDEVVQTVTNAVKGNKQQSPQFGKIAGLEDENGTFFFMRK
jgi:tetratricopeptide (TPR) repeat protein